jgi:Protein of unknown function (DUF1573)
MYRVRTLILVSVFFCIVFTLVAMNFKSKKSLPSNHQYKYSFDLGFVPLGHIFNKTISVTNDTSEDWHLVEIRQSCSCTQAKVDRHVLKPGESTDITVQFTSPEQESDQRHSVELNFKAKCQPNVSISVISKTRKPLSVDRKNLELTTTNVKPVSVFEIFVSNFSGKPWSSVTCDELPACFQMISCEKQPPVPWGELWKMVLTIDGSQMKSGKDSGTLLIQANGLAERINYHASYDEGIRYSPVRFNVGQVQTDKFNLITTVQVDHASSYMTKDDFKFIVHDAQFHAELEQLTIQRPGRAVLSIGLSRLKRQPGRQQLTFDIVYGSSQNVKQTFIASYFFE